MKTLDIQQAQKAEITDLVRKIIIASPQMFAEIVAKGTEIKQYQFAHAAFESLDHPQTKLLTRESSLKILNFLDSLIYCLLSDHKISIHDSKGVRYYVPEGELERSDEIFFKAFRHTGFFTEKKAEITVNDLISADMFSVAIKDKKPAYQFVFKLLKNLGFDLRYVEDLNFPLLPITKEIALDLLDQLNTGTNNGNYNLGTVLSDSIKAVAAKNRIHGAALLDKMRSLAPSDLICAYIDIYRKYPKGFK